MIFEFILASLLTYRVSRMIAIEDGPLDAFAWLREKIDPKQRTWIGRGINCPLCVSVWIGMIATLLLNPSDWRVAILLWGGVSAMTVILHKVIA